MVKKTKIEGVTVRMLIESERAFFLLNSRSLENGGVAWNLAKIARKAEPEIKAYRKLITKYIEDTDKFIRDDDGIRIDPKCAGYEALRKKADAFSEDALDKVVDLGEGVGPVKYADLLAAMPKRNIGTTEDPDWKEGTISPSILAPLMDWAIEE